MANTLKDLIKKTKNTFKDEGLKPLITKTNGYIRYIIKNPKAQKKVYKDILFINGCELPHPQRYRVDHQIEQLEAFGVSCDKIFYADLSLDILKYYRGFIFFRCPFIPIIEEFINKAKENNKSCFFDIDDLVYDTKYTNKIKYLDSMTKAERELYDDGVKRMGKTMRLCDYGITSTTRLKTEMSKIMQDVCLNRNVASEAMRRYSDEAKKLHLRDDDKITLGYFSGSITHNDDFAIVIPVISKLFKKYNNLFLRIVGILDVPKELEQFKDRIITSKFTSWKELPELISSVDINLAPLEDNIFNEAKSENKWTEAALVNVPTVASKVGAFKEIIEDGKTGFLCESEKQWEKALENLIENRNLRVEIGRNAFMQADKQYITTYTGKTISDYIKSKLKPNVFFVMPSCNTSGGTLVAMKHATILKKNGYDVTLINAEEYEGELECFGSNINVVSVKNREFYNSVHTIVATMWVTLKYVLRFEKCLHRKYLVQNFETDFYQFDHKERYEANATYNQVPGTEYLTISKWCEQWLRDNFHDDVKYAPNGINPSQFPFRKREFNGKIKVLIEGDSKSTYKNTDESFKRADMLDRSKYEIIYLSYNGKPKKKYRYDKFYHNIPYSDVAKIYSECDILLKSSTLESFSYPPLEMMATGGFCVVRQNEGNKEYLKNMKNCLFYDPNDLSSAVKLIEHLSEDASLREKIEIGSRSTVSERDWGKIEKQILRIYN